MPIRSEARDDAIVAAVALLVRGGVALAITLAVGSEAHLTADSARYLELARSLAGDGAHALRGVPELLRPPGYPALLAPGVVMGQPVAFGIVANLLLGILTAVLVRRVAAAAGVERRQALGAGLLVAADPVLVAWSARIMAETLLAFVVTAALALLAAHERSRGRVALCAAALAASGAAFVKPIAVPLPFALGAVLLARDVRRGRGAAGGLVFLVVASLPIVAWQARNHAQTGSFVFSTQAARALLFSHGVEGDDFLAERARLEARHAAALTPHATPEDQRRVLRAGAGNVLRDPLAWAVRYGRGVARTLISPGAMPFVELFLPRRALEDLVTISRAEGIAAAVAAMHERTPIVFLVELPFLVYGCGVLGLAFRGARVPSLARPFLLATAAVFLLLAGGPWAQSRFRAPAVPPLALLAAIAQESRRTRPSLDP